MFLWFPVHKKDQTNTRVTKPQLDITKNSYESLVKWESVYVHGTEAGRVKTIPGVIKKKLALEMTKSSLDNCVYLSSEVFEKCEPCFLDQGRQLKGRNKHTKEC